MAQFNTAYIYSSQGDNSSSICWWKISGTASDLYTNTILNKHQTYAKCAVVRWV